jgi:hypothetical protein
MRTLRPGLLLAVTAALLASCGGIPRVAPGPLKVGSAQVTVGRNWSDVTALLPGASKKVRVLSIDGPLLNRLYVTDGLAPGDYLVKRQAKERPTPLIRSDMTVTERIEFVADSLSAMDYQRVETSRPRPATLNGKPGVRFDIAAKTEDGLDIKGAAVAAEVEGRTYLVVYLAPQQHYYEATLAEVEAIMASARPGA